MFGLMRRRSQADERKPARLADPASFVGVSEADRARCRSATFRTPRSPRSSGSRPSARPPGPTWRPARGTRLRSRGRSIPPAGPPTTGRPCSTAWPSSSRSPRATASSCRASERRPAGSGAGHDRSGKGRRPGGRASRDGPAERQPAGAEGPLGACAEVRGGSADGRSRAVLPTGAGLQLDHDRRRRPRGSCR